MSIEWVIGVLVASLSGLLGFYIHHIAACNERDRIRSKESQEIASALASIRETLRRLDSELGTHETGLRGQVHRLRSEILPFVMWAQLEQKKRDGDGV